MHSQLWSGTGHIRSCLLALGIVCLGASSALAQEEGPIPPFKLKPQDIPKVDAADGVKQVPTVNVNSPARFDNLGVRGWNLAFPSYGETLTQDIGGYRTKLASIGVGFETITVGQLTYNLSGTPTSTNGRQAYIGQRLSATEQIIPIVTVDLSRYGISDGQITVAASLPISSIPTFIPRNQSIYDLNYYQTFFNKKLQVRAGLISNGQEFVGFYTGGQIAGTIFGPSSVIPFAVGLSSGAAYGVNATYNFTDNIYNKVGVQRSTSPTPNTIFDESVKNPTGFRFAEPGHGVVYINEFGYKDTVSGLYHTWVRAGGIYNTSEYRNYKTGKKDTNGAFYLLGDQQIWQPIKSGPARALGLYGGFSVNYAPPDTNIFSQYYEARLYAVGLVPGRPRDIGGVVATYNVFSSALANTINSVSRRTNTFARTNSTSVTASYAARVITGVYLTSALTYTDHPSFQYTKKEGSALNARFALTSIF